MISAVILFFVLISGSVVAAVFGHSFSKTAPVFFMALIVVFFVLGMAINLNAAFWVIILLAVLAYVAAVCVGYKTKNSIATLLRFQGSGVVIFLTMYVFFLWCTYGMRGGVSTDEFTHWIYIVREMLRLDDFGTNPAANAMFASYPPGMALFQYLFQKIHLLADSAGGFSEWRCYFSYHILMSVLYVPFCVKIYHKSKSYLCTAILMMVLFLLPTVYYEAYFDIKIDPICAIFLGTGISRILIEDEKDLWYKLYIWLECFVLVLMKDSGMALAVVLFLSYVLDEVANSKYAHIGTQRNRAVNVIKTLLVFGCAVVIPKLLWGLHLSLHQTPISFGNEFNPIGLVKEIISGEPSYKRKVLSNFCYAFLERNVWVHSYSSEENQLTINYLVLFLSFMTALYGLVCYKAYKNPDRPSQIWQIILFAVFFVVYVAGLCVAYLYNFSEGEALQLAAFPRYIHVPYLAFSVVVILLVAELFAGSVRWSKFLFLALLCLTLNTAPRLFAFKYVTRVFVKQSITRMMPYDAVSQTIVDACDENSRIAYISQEDWQHPYVCIRYNIRPCELLLLKGWTSWKITESFWGEVQDLTNAERLQTELLQNYDYLVVYMIDDYFIEEYSTIFEDPDNITGESLYQVNRKTGLLRKVH